MKADDKMEIINGARLEHSSRVVKASLVPGGSASDQLNVLLRAFTFTAAGQGNDLETVLENTKAAMEDAIEAVRSGALMTAPARALN